ADRRPAGGEAEHRVRLPPQQPDDRLRRRFVQFFLVCENVDLQAGCSPLALAARALPMTPASSGHRAVVTFTFAACSGCSRSLSACRTGASSRSPAFDTPPPIT